MTQPEQREPLRDDLLLDNEGISTTEYLILMILVAIAGFGTWALFGDAVEKKIEPTQNTHQVSEVAIV